MSSAWAKIGRWCLLATFVANLSACNTDGGGILSSGGKFLPGDGLPSGHRIDIAAVPNAVPKDENLSKTGNKPYQVYGKSYRPLESASDYQAEGMASWYGTKFHGRKTSSGEPYDMYAMSAAHRTLPLPSYVRVTNLANKRSVVVKVNDRGPFVNTSSRIIDLSYVAAAKLGVVETGTARVRLETVQAAPSNTMLSSSEPIIQQVLVHEAVAEGEMLTDSESEVSSETVTSIQTEPAPALANVNEQKSYLQMGAFSVRYNAEQLVRRLSQVGITADLSHVEGLYKVISGPFSNTDQAIRQKLEIDRMLNLKSRLIL